VAYDETTWYAVLKSQARSSENHCSISWATDTVGGTKFWCISAFRCIAACCWERQPPTARIIYYTPLVSYIHYICRYTIDSISFQIVIHHKIMVDINKKTNIFLISGQFLLCLSTTCWWI